VYIPINSLFFDVILLEDISHFFIKYIESRRNFSINLFIASVKIGKDCSNLIIGLITALASMTMELKICMSIWVKKFRPTFSLFLSYVS
jgi:hypothetical protein